MKPLVLLLVLFSLVAPPAHSLDWGGSLTGYGSLDRNGDLDLYGEAATAAWITAPLGEYYAFLTQGSVVVSTEPLVTADLDLLYVDGLAPLGDRLATGVTAGRFVFSEFSRLVFSHRGDGVLFTAAGQRAVTRLGAVYTGLLLKPNADITLSRLDELDDQDDNERLAPRRLIGMVELALIEPLPRTDITVSVLAQHDLRDQTGLIGEGETTPTDANGGRVNTQYALLGIDGSITSRWFYRLAGGIQTGQVLSFFEDDFGQPAYQETWMLAWIAAGEARYLAPGPLATSVSLSLLSSSGDADAPSLREGYRSERPTQFLPVAGQTIGLVSGVAAGNLTAASLDVTVRPVPTVQTGLSAVTLFRTADGGPVDLAGVNTEASGRYLGSEASASVTVRPFSDLGASIAAGVFVPNQADSGPIDSLSRDPRYTVQALVSLSF